MQVSTLRAFRVDNLTFTPSPAQAAYVATPGEVLARNMTESGRYGSVSASDKVLFVTFTSDEDPSTSALCRCRPVGHMIFTVRLFSSLV